MSSTTRKRSLLTFDRADFSATYALLGLIAIGTALVAVVWPLIDWWRGVPLSWLVATVDAGPAVAANPGAVAHWNDGVQVTLDHASATARITAVLPGLLTTAAVLLVALQLLPLLRAIQTGEPFVAASVRRLRVIALVLAIAPVLTLVATAMAGAVIRAEAIPSASFALEFSPSGIIVPLATGLMVAALAEAFSRGAQLRADTDGLV